MQPIFVQKAACQCLLRPVVAWHVARNDNTVAVFIILAIERLQVILDRRFSAANTLLLAAYSHSLESEAHTSPIRDARRLNQMVRFWRDCGHSLCVRMFACLLKGLNAFLSIPGLCEQQLLAPLFPPSFLRRLAAPIHFIQRGGKTMVSGFG